MTPLINLATPISSERVRSFQPPWRTVYVYRCVNGHETRVFANSFRGKRPEPSVGAIVCPLCERVELCKTGDSISISA